jgi:hypothetical protein
VDYRKINVSQVEVQPDGKEKTGFSTGKWLWHFRVKSFGLCNTPATCEKLMERVFRYLAYDSGLVYLDDVIVIDHTF